MMSLIMTMWHVMVVGILLERGIRMPMMNTRVMTMGLVHIMMMPLLIVK